MNRTKVGLGDVEELMGTEEEDPDVDGMLNNMTGGELLEFDGVEDMFTKHNAGTTGGPGDRDNFDTETELLEEGNQEPFSPENHRELTPELVDLEPDSPQAYVANTADVEHDHAFARTAKAPRNQPSKAALYYPQLLPKPVPLLNTPLFSSLPPNFVFTAPDGKVFRVISTEGGGSAPAALQFDLGPSLNQNDPVSASTETAAELGPVPVPITSPSELGLGQTVTLGEEVSYSDADAEFTEENLEEFEEEGLSFEPAPSAGSGGKKPRRPTANSDVMKSSMLNIEVPGGGGVFLQLQRYIYTHSLCRVCLLAKENMICLFEDVNVTERGQIENARGPNTSNRFNTISALKTLLDIDVAYGDALPDHICVECTDNLMSFSEFRKRISLGQTKLYEIVAQVKGSNTPTVIPPLGIVDLGKANVYRHFDLISNVKEMLRTTKYAHNVVRFLPDRSLEQIFNIISNTVGYKSGKLKSLEKFAVDPPFVKAWYCAFCRLTISGSTTDFTNHFRDEHGILEADEVLFGCDLCNEHFPLLDKSGMSQNYAQHWLQHLFFYECELCQKRMPSAKGVWVHKRSAHAGEDRPFKCPHCPKTFFKKPHLVTHLRTHLNPEERKAHMNWCTLCGKGLTSSLTVHMSTVHADTVVGADSRWKCEICGKYFKKKENLIGHRDAVHHGMKKYQCGICSEMFKSHSTKTLHMLRHKGLKPYNCDVCDKDFLSIHSLKSHQVTHNTDPGKHYCEICKKTFKRKVYLSEHMKVHGGEKSAENSHVCPYPDCAKLIRMKSNWYKHLKVHERRARKAQLDQDGAPEPVPEQQEEEVGEELLHETASNITLIQVE